MSSLDLIVTCPYDKTHRIRKSVLAYHLIRCRKNNSSQKIHCPFDVCHVIDEAYFKKHMLNCASSGDGKSKPYNFEPPHQLGTVSLETVKNLCVPIMEDWKEENIATYDPWKNTEERNIIRCLIGATKSKKRKFKLLERQRIQNLEKGSMNSYLRKNFKHKSAKKLRNVTQLNRNLKQLSLNDTDILLNIDISNLFISKVNKKNTFMEKKYITNFVEKILMQKFKQLLLYSTKN